MTRLPYRARTASGETFDIEFPLHGQTQNAVRVAQILSAVLEAIDKDIALAGESSNGDVLQAVAMAMAIRARIIHGRQDAVEQLSVQLLQAALKAVAAADHRAPQAGHA